MNSHQTTAVERADGIDIFAILHVVWRYRYFIGSLSIFCGLLAVYLALTATESFRAEAVLTEVHDSGLSGSGSGLAGQLGGLASLAGALGGAGGAADANSQGVLGSRNLIEQFITTHGLVPLLTPSSGKRATLWFAVKRFQDQVVTIHNDPLKGLTTVTIDWPDPVKSAKWANDFVALANDLIRTQAFEDASRNVAYLNKQIAQTNQVEIQRSLSDLIESETKKLMLANGRRDYAFRVVDPAVPPEVRHSPRRTLWVASGIALGGFLGVMISLGHDAFRRRKAKL